MHCASVAWGAVYGGVVEALGIVVRAEMGVAEVEVG